MSKKIQLVNLYKKSFDDSEQFINNFFTQYYISKNVVSYTDNGKVISALHLMPKNIAFHDRIWRLPFIVGAATLKEYRGQGYFKKLFKKTMLRLIETNTPFVMLYPQEREMYYKMGFIDISFAGETTLKYDGNDARRITFDAEEISNFFNEYLQSHFDFCQYRNTKEVAKITERWACEGIEPEIYERDGKICYIAMSDKEIEEVVGEVSVLNGVKKLDGKTITDFSKQDNPYVMARLVNATKLLDSIVYIADGDFKFKVVDRYMPQVEAVLSLKIKRGVPTVTTADSFDFEVSSQDLLRAAFGLPCDCPLTEVIGAQKTVFIDKY